MVEAMMVFLPFSCSLISMGVAMEYVKVDLGMLFAANPLKKHPNVASSPIENQIINQPIDDGENLLLNNIDVDNIKVTVLN